MFLAVPCLFWMPPQLSHCLHFADSYHLALNACHNLAWHWLHVECGYCLALNACECHMMLAAADPCTLMQPYIQQVVHAYVQTSQPVI